MYSKTELAEIKYLIFSRYITQKVLWNGVELVECDKCWNWKHESFRLILKPLSSITDEDKRYVCILQNKDYDKFNDIDIHFDLTDKENFDVCICHEEYKHDYYECVSFASCQYLQLKGYALPQLVILNGKPITLSVEDQIKYGIIELK